MTTNLSIKIEKMKINLNRKLDLLKRDLIIAMGIMLTAKVCILAALEYWD